MSTTTLTQMIALVRADGELPISVIDDTELTGFINVSVRRLRTLMDSLRSDVSALPVTSTTINVVSGTNAYNLPSGFLKLVSLDGLDTYSYPYSLEQFAWQDRDLLDYPFLNYLYLSYYILGSQLHLRPTPTKSETLTIRYIAEPTDLATGSDTFDNFNFHGQQWVLADVLIRYFRRRGMDHGLWSVERQDSEDMLRRQYGSRDKFGVSYMSSPAYKKAGPL